MTAALEAIMNNGHCVTIRDGCARRERRVRGDTALYLFATPMM